MNSPPTHRILLADDDPAGAELTVAALKHLQPKIDVTIVTDGEETLSFLKQRPASELPSLVLLDLKMPKVDGHEVLQEIRSEPGLRALPVVILTSSDLDSDRARSQELGCNGYLVKPVSIDAFIQDLRRLLNFSLPAGGADQR